MCEGGLQVHERNSAKRAIGVGGRRRDFRERAGGEICARCLDGEGELCEVLVSTAGRRYRRCEWSDMRKTAGVVLLVWKWV